MRSRILLGLTVGVLALLGAWRMPGLAEPPGPVPGPVLPPGPGIVDDGDTLSWQNPIAFASIGYGGGTGEWMFGTTGGDPLRPEDDNQIFVDQAVAALYLADTDEELEIGGDAAEELLVPPFVDLAQQIGAFTWRSGDTVNPFTVEFRLTLVRDVAKWEYRITNNGARTRRVGFRTFFDLDFLGEPAAPYFMPVRGMYNTTQEFKGTDVPSEWFVRYTPLGFSPIDLGYRPLLMARQPLQGTVTRPERIAFGTVEEVSAYTWPDIREAELPENAQDPPILPIGQGYIPEESFGVGLYYPILSLPARQTRVICGEFQMNWAQVSTSDHFALAVVTPDWTGFRTGDNPATPGGIENGYFEPAALPIRAYVNNSQLVTSPQVTVSIDLGDGLALSPGQSSGYSLRLSGLQDILARRADGDSYSWLVAPTGTASGLVPVRVTANFNNGLRTTTITSTTYVNVPAIPQRTLGAGLHLLGFPFSFGNPDTAVALGLGPWVQLAWWDPGLEGYRYAASDGIQLETGRGYWLRLVTPTTVILRDASPINQRADYLVAMAAGWNMISNPYQFSIEWGKCAVYYGGFPLSIPEAVRRGLLRPELWSWDALQNDYQPPLNPTPQNQFTTEMKPFQGYWLFVREPLLLVYKPNLFVPAMDPSTPTARGRARTAGSADSWRVNLLVSAGDAKDRWNTFGVEAGEDDGLSAGDVLEAPISPAGLSGYFVRGAPGRAEGRLAVDLQAPGTPKTWSFEVRCDRPNETVTIRWPDLTQLPSGAPAVLTDQLTGRCVVMRTSPGYSFTSGDGGVRRFTIVVGGALERLRFTQARATASRNRGATITYGVTIPAQVELRVRTATGRLVRTLSPGRAGAGLATLTWDGRDERNRMLPAGVYLCELYAEAEDGQRARAALTVPTR